MEYLTLQLLTTEWQAEEQRIGLLTFGHKWYIFVLKHNQVFFSIQCPLFIFVTPTSLNYQQCSLVIWSNQPLVYLFQTIFNSMQPSGVKDLIWEHLIFKFQINCSKKTQAISFFNPFLSFFLNFFRKIKGYGNQQSFSTLESGNVIFLLKYVVWYV